MVYVECAETRGCLLTRIECRSDHAEMLHFPWDSHAGTEIEEGVSQSTVARKEESASELPVVFANCRGPLELFTIRTTYITITTGHGLPQMAG